MRGLFAKRNITVGVGRLKWYCLAQSQVRRMKGK